AGDARAVSRGHDKFLSQQVAGDVKDVRTCIEFARQFHKLTKSEPGAVATGSGCWPISILTITAARSLPLSVLTSTLHHIRHNIAAVITNPITTTARRINTRPTRRAVRAPT